MNMQNTAFDVDSIQSLQQAEVPIVHPKTLRPAEGAFITLAAPDHLVRRSFTRKRARQVQQELDTKGRVEELSQQEEYDALTELLVISTLGWRGISQGDAALAFDADAARRVYGDPKLGWLRRQMLTELNNDINFIRLSAGQ